MILSPPACRGGHHSLGPSFQQSLKLYLAQKNSENALFSPCSESACPRTSRDGTVYVTPYTLVSVAMCMQLRLTVDCHHCVRDARGPMESLSSAQLEHRVPAHTAHSQMCTCEHVRRHRAAWVQGSCACMCTLAHTRTHTCKQKPKRVRRKFTRGPEECHKLIESAARQAKTPYHMLAHNPMQQPATFNSLSETGPPPAEEGMRR